MHALVAEAAQHDLRERHLLFQRRDVALGFAAGREHGDLARPVGDGAQHQVDADRGDVKALEGDDARRQPAPGALGAEPAYAEAGATADCAHGTASGFHIVDQYAGIPAARVAINLQQRLQPRAEVGHARIGVGHGAGGTDRRAAAAAGAQMRFDLDVVAVDADRTGRADVEALRAARLAGAAVRANALAVLREARLAEFADQRGELLRRQRLLERIGARCCVALRQVGQPDQRLAR